jgi:hypothetical protein
MDRLDALTNRGDEIGPPESLGEPVVHRRQHVPGLSGPALVMLEMCEAHGRPQFPGEGALVSRQGRAPPGSISRRQPPRAAPRGAGSAWHLGQSLGDGLRGFVARDAVPQYPWPPGAFSSTTSAQPHAAHEVILREDRARGADESHEGSNARPPSSTRPKAPRLASTRALVASVGEASPSSVRARGQRDPPGRLRVHRRAIDGDGAGPGGAGGAVRHGVGPSGRLLVRRSGSLGAGARVGAGAELSLRGLAQLPPRGDGGTGHAPVDDGPAAATGGCAHATR